MKGEETMVNFIHNSTNALIAIPIVALLVLLFNAYKMGKFKKKKKDKNHEKKKDD